MNDKVKTALAFVFVLVLYGIVGWMDYQDEMHGSAIRLVCTPQVAEEQYEPAGSSGPLRAQAVQVDYRPPAMREIEPVPRVFRCVVVG